MGLSPMSAYFEGPQVFFGGNAGKAVPSEVRKSSHHPPTFARCWVCQFDGANLTRDCTNFPSGSRSSTALEPFLFDQKTHPLSLIHGALTCFPRIQWQRRLQAKGANLGTPSWAEVLNGLKNITCFCFFCFFNPKAKHTDADGSATGRDKKVESLIFFSSSLSHVMWTVRMTHDDSVRDLTSEAAHHAIRDLPPKSRHAMACCQGPQRSDDKWWVKCLDFEKTYVMKSYYLGIMMLLRRFTWCVSPVPVVSLPRTDVSIAQVQPGTPSLTIPSSGFGELRPPILSRLQGQNKKQTKPVACPYELISFQEGFMDFEIFFSVAGRLQRGLVGFALCVTTDIWANIWACA